LRRFSRTWPLISAFMLLAAGSAFASGFSIFEQGAKATAMGGAFAATADDPSAIFYNVAGIAQQRHTAFYLGGTAINFANEFSGDPNDAFTSGQKGFYKRHTFIPPNAYAVVPIGGNLTFGVGLMTPYGLRTNWDDPWVGRFSSRDANIKVLSVEPALAWQSSSGVFAIGGGIEYRRGRVVLNRNNALPGINPFNQRISDVANAYLSSDWESGTTWNAGLLFKPGTWRIGLAYRADMDIDFNGDITVTQIPTGVPAVDAQVAQGLPHNQGVKTSIPFPAVASLGIATTAIPNWDIEADITHTTWSRFKALAVNFNDQPAFSFVRAENWDDTYSYRLGANHTVNKNWDIRLGVLYDENPEPVQAVSPLLPDSDREGVTFGVGYHHGPFTIDATEFVLHFKKRSTQGVSPDFVNGIYRTDANLVSLNFGYRF
jgi:long-chain fatty acid transport protein